MAILWWKFDKTNMSRPLFSDPIEYKKLRFYIVFLADKILSHVTHVGGNLASNTTDIVLSDR